MKREILQPRILSKVSRRSFHSLRLLPSVLVVFTTQLFAKDDPTIFKSDVALTRVDAQVVDREGRAITGLTVDDFILRFNGRVLPIRNFASENMPVDILLLLDVSGSMEPHVQRIASAAQQALNVLAPKDRVAIMVFDTTTRVRLPFRNSHSEVTGGLDDLLRSERFNGGTRITRALLDAANYVRREARQDARRAIVILTDDETQDQEDEPAVEAALDRANAVLSFLQAPYEEPSITGMPRRPHGTWGSGGGGWPGGGGIGFPGGGGPIVFGPGRRGGYGGIDPSHTAGTATIARDSGGDVMRVDDASALEDTLARLRQRYALFFNWPEGSEPGSRATIEVNLSRTASRRYEMAEIRYRRVYMSGSSQPSGPALVTRTQPPVSTIDESEPPSQEPTPQRRSTAVNEDSEPRITTVPADSSNESPDNPAAPAPESRKSGGWRRASQPKPAQ